MELYRYNSDNPQLDPQLIYFIQQMRTYQNQLNILQEQFFTYLIQNQSMRESTAITSNHDGTANEEENSSFLQKIKNQLIFAKQMIEKQNREKILLVNALKQERQKKVREDRTTQTENDVAQTRNFNDSTFVRRIDTSQSYTRSINGPLLMMSSESEISNALREREFMMQQEQQNCPQMTNRLNNSPAINLVNDSANCSDRQQKDTSLIFSEIDNNLSSFLETSTNKNTKSFHETCQQNEYREFRDSNIVPSNDQFPFNKAYLYEDKDAQNKNSTTLRMKPPRVSIPSLRIQSRLSQNSQSSQGGKPIDIFRNFQDTRRSQRREDGLEESPQPMQTHRTNTTVTRIDEIYSDNYWQRRVNLLISEKKNILKVTEDAHKEIRKVTEENLRLQQELREKDKYIEQLQLQQVISHSIPRTRVTHSALSMTCSKNIEDKVLTQIDQNTITQKHQQRFSQGGIPARKSWINPVQQITEEDNESVFGKQSQKGTYEYFTQDYDLDDVKSNINHGTGNSVLDYSKGNFKFSDLDDDDDKENLITTEQLEDDDQKFEMAKPETFQGQFTNQRYDTKKNYFRYQTNVDNRPFKSKNQRCDYYYQEDEYTILRKQSDYTTEHEQSTYNRNIKYKQHGYQKYRKPYHQKKKSSHCYNQSSGTSYNSIRYY